MKKEEYQERYKQLMSVEDRVLRIYNANEHVLRNKVYNSKAAPEELKRAIRTRRLGGIKREDFLEAYRKTYKAETQKPNQTKALAVLEDNLDIVPVRINPDTLAISGHTENYLVQTCQEYGLTLGQLKDMIDLKVKYQTHLPTLLKILNRGYSIEDLDEFLETREALTEEGVDMPSLKKIIEFYEAFYSTPVDSEELATDLQQIKTDLKKEHTDFAIQDILRVAREFGLSTLEAALDALKGAKLKDESGPVVKKRERCGQYVTRQENTFYRPGKND